VGRVQTVGPVESGCGANQGLGGISAVGDSLSSFVKGEHNVCDSNRQRGAARCANGDIGVVINEHAVEEHVTSEGVEPEAGVV
jgi:hypothetical protein